MSIMLAASVPVLGRIQERRALVLERWSGVMSHYEKALSETEGPDGEDIRDEIIRKLVSGLELSDSERAYLKSRGLNGES